MLRILVDSNHHLLGTNGSHSPFPSTLHGTANKETPVLQMVSKRVSEKKDFGQMLSERCLSSVHINLLKLDCMHIHNNDSQFNLT